MLNDKQKKKVAFLKCRYERKMETPNEINGIIIEDQEITDDYTSIPRCYGNVEINSDEQDVLSLPPKYAIFEKVDKIECMAEIEKGLTKMRWNQKSNEDKNKQIVDRFINIDNNTMNFNGMKPTELPFNKRVYLPKPGNPDLERKI